MDHAGIVPRRVLSERLFEATPLSPAALAGTLAAALVGLLLLMGWLTGDLALLSRDSVPWWQNRDARLAVVVSLFAAAVVTSLRYHAVGTRQDLLAVARLGGWRVEDVDPTRSEGDAFRERRAALLGLAVIPVLALLVDRDPGLYFMEGYWLVSKAWTWLLGSAAVAGLAVLIYRTARDARHFSRLAERLPEIDLLDGDGLVPFARQAVRATVPGVLGLSFIALNAIDQDFALAVGALLVFALAGGAIVLAIPLRGVRQRVRRAKREELARTHAAIRGEPGALDGSPLAGRDAPGLADLLAWRAQVASVPEWPLDPSTLGRYGVYLAIPVASWIGGALVERLLDAVLS